MQHNKAAWRTGLQLDGTPAHNDEHYDDCDDDDHEDDQWLWRRSESSCGIFNLKLLHFSLHSNVHDHDRDHDQDQEDVDNSDPMR